MAGPDPHHTPADELRSLYRALAGAGGRQTTWRRTLVVYPWCFTLPSAALSVLRALGSTNSIARIDWGYWAIPVGAALAVVCSAWTIARSPLSGRERAQAATASLLMTAFAAGVSVVIWLYAAHLVCHGGSDCPF